MFPEESIIKAGEQLIIDRSLSKLSLNNGGDMVLLKDFLGQIQDEVEYSSAKEGKSLSKVKIDLAKNYHASNGPIENATTWSWEWLSPSPGKSNPMLKEYEGKVLSFEENTLTLDHLGSQEQFKSEQSSTNNLLFRPGNTLLVQAFEGEKIKEIVSVSLLAQAQLSENSKKSNWPLIITLLLIGGIVLKHKSQKKSEQGLIFEPREL